MRLFAILVATAIVAVGDTLELPKTTAAGYFDATFHLRQSLADYSVFAVAAFRNWTNLTSFDSYHRNYTTLIGIIDFVKPLYDEIAKLGLNQMKSELRASNHSRLTEMNVLIGESREYFASANASFAHVLHFIKSGKYPFRMNPYSKRSYPLNHLLEFHSRSEIALTKWVNVLKEVGTPNTSWGLERFLHHDGNEVIDKVRSIIHIL
uniref:GLOBIN domain-containing protein n=1 Tax=Panagrellus redivivus TaxID=6233 RepID=A0A7E4UY47_PANRE